MNLHTLLQEREAQGRPIRVGLIGAGKFGSMFLSQARLIPGIQVAGIADLQIERIQAALTKTGWTDESMQVAHSEAEVNDLSAAGRIAMVEDSSHLIDAELEVIIECTGIPEVGVRHALRAFNRASHVIMVNVEADCLVGPLLQEKAKYAGVVYSLAYGDQPAIICEMVDWARACGFEVMAAGKGTKYLPEYHHCTPDTVWDYYGFTEEQLAQGDFNPKMFNSFLDGTKSAIEMAAVANATALVPQPEGLSFPPVSARSLADTLKPKEDGGSLTRSGTVEVISCLDRGGSLLEDDLRFGVFVTFKAPTEYVRRCFAEYGLYTDSSGLYAGLYRPAHLIGLELSISVASAALRGEPTGSARGFVGDVGSVAKRDLRPGDVLDGEGGYTVYGKLLPAGHSLSKGVLPLGLASDLKVKRPVAADGWVSYDDVETDPHSMVLNLRQEMEVKFRHQ
jgi:predicted homoserine dehydrogenase-like protein